MRTRNSPDRAFSMLPEVESLLIVQNRDQKINTVQQNLAKIPRDKARAEDKLSKDKKAVADAKTATKTTK
ncbi:hypothetical protein [Rubritalea tangerina]|uniref:hypothetical protein n=1 Tax=Rubritalea tangerina TaxID=430798 RepID=UPI003614D320